MNDWEQYADSTIRETYPPAPRTGGNTNKEMSDATIGMVVSQHASAVQYEAEFRARQRTRRLRTRGAAAMRDPEESLSTSEIELPDDPELDEYKQAGWLG